MGRDFKAEMELLTKELPKDQDGLAIDLSPFKASARKCTLQLLDMVTANKPAAGGAAQACRRKLKLLQFFLLVICHFASNNGFCKASNCNEFRAGNVASPSFSTVMFLFLTARSRWE
jgi:hypothetical protein